MFPYYSEEARRYLGLPDSPALHLAVTSLADRLMPFASDSTHEPRIVRITALRTASRSLLEELPFEQVAFDFCSNLELPCDANAAAAAMRTTRTDWLGLATAKIRAAGIDTGPDAARMATPYGWNAELAQRNVEPAAPRSVLTDAERTVFDERGRAWTLPADVAGMKESLNAYGQTFGHRPSDAVMAAFRRHAGGWRTLWMLVLRGVEGERLNLAARALALGPIPPLRQVLSPTSSGVPRSEEFKQRKWAANDERDRYLVQVLEAEAEEFRALGYAD